MWIRFSRFQAVGALGVGLQLSLVAFLTESAGLEPFVATAAAVGVTLVHNFGWHQVWTWRGRATGWAAIRRAFVRFALANGVLSLAGNVLITVALAGIGVRPVLANAIAIAACGVINFWLGERVVFRGPLLRPSAGRRT